MKKDRRYTTVATEGKRGYTVAVCKRADSPNLFLRWWDRRRQRHCFESLGHGDLAEAKKEGQRMSTAFLHDLDERGDASLEVIFARYERERTPYKSPAQHKADRRRMDMWQRFLDGLEPEQIDVAVLDRFVDDRRAGRIEGFRPVRGRQIEIDVRWLSAVFRWASSVAGSGRGKLLSSNPIQGYKNRAMGEKNPNRPLASWEGFLRVYRYADRVDPQHLLRWLLLLSESLGWRVSALCNLRARDIDLASRPATPHGRIRKDPSMDKEGVGGWVPLSETARRAAEGLLRQRKVIGNRYLFRSARDPNKPWTKDHAQKLHRKAQYLAGAGHRLEHGAHGECLRCGDVVDARGKDWFKLYSACTEAPYVGWHAYRRKWVTERKHLPRKDVAAAGGWRSEKTLDLYEKTDEETLLAVVNEPRKLRELRQG